MATNTIKISKTSRNPRCNCCGSTSKVLFYKSHSVLDKHTGYLNYCKTCIKEQWDKFTITHKSYEYCIYLMCRLFDYPYIPEYTKKVLKSWEGISFDNTSTTKNEYPFPKYLTTLTASGRQKGYVSFIDGQVDYVQGKVTISTGEFEVTDQMRHIWGNNYKSHEYKFLETEYTEYCKTTKDDTTQQQRIIVQICILQLKIRKAQESDATTNKEHGDLVRQWQDLIKTAGLDAKSRKEMDDAKSLDTFGLRIKEMEMNEPAEFYEDKKLYRDYDKLLHLLKKYVLRPLRNLVADLRDFDVSFEDGEDDSNG